MDNSNRITYQLYIQLKNDVTLRIGKLGIFQFPAGTYTYTGSAKRNIEARIRRHTSTIKKLKWHIDYLLANPNAKIILSKQFSEQECQLNQKTTGKILIPKFGASDCNSGCGSHLKYNVHHIMQVQGNKEN